MTTPICNCPENIGWLPETSWGLSEASKSSGERIYCVDGVPKVHPRGKFVGNYGAATLACATDQPWDPTGEVSAIAGAVDGRLLVVNDQPYTVHLMGLLRFDWYVALTGANNYQVLSISPRVVTDSGTVASFAQRAATIGTASPLQSINGSFLAYLGALAPGASVRYYVRNYWTITNDGSADSASLNYTGSLTVFGGTH